MTQKWQRLLPLAALMLAGCAVGPDYQPPPLAMSPAFTPAPAGTAATGLPMQAIDLARWWQALRDPQLDELVEQAVAGNPDIEIALTRLQAARTTEIILIGSELPTIDADGGAGNGTGSDVTRGRVPSLLTSADSTAKTRQIRQVGGFDGVWQADLVGQYRRLIEAGIDDAEAARDARNVVLVGVIAQVVGDYIDLRGTQMRAALLGQDIRVASQSRDFVKIRYQRGLINELDLTLAERELSALQAQAAPLQARIDSLRYDIATLLGRNPEELMQALGRAAPIPALPERIEPGLPLDLIKRRPDIRQNERQLAAATARIGVAIGNLFPHVAMDASVGAQFATIGTGSASHIWSLGPAASWPLLDFGALDAQVEIADLQTHAQLITYKRSILEAVREVDADIGNFSAQQDRVRNLGDALAQGQRAVELAQQRYDRGLTDYLNVVDAERQYDALEAALVAAQQSAALSFVALFKALGGGWESYQQLPEVRQPRPALIAMFERLLAPPQGERSP